MHRWARAVLGAALVVASLAMMPATASGAPSGDPVRIMLLGDSVTQGSSGDWTWRYRLWRRLVTAGVSADLVGPRADLWDARTDGPGAISYADPAFDRDHAAQWGMFAALPDTAVTSLVSTHQPDVLVVMLGINDLIWTTETPAQVAASVGRLVAAARSVRPDIDVVVSEVTQHWFPEAPELNAELAGLVSSLTTELSHVVLAATAAGYDLARDTYDTSHPNARGEVRIATAVADALHRLGIGPAALLPDTMPEVGPRTPATLTVDTTGALSWTAGPGATGQLLWRRDVTAREAWNRLPDLLPADGRLVPTGLLRHHRYEFRLQPVRGDDLPEGEVRSGVAILQPGGPPPVVVPPVLVPSAPTRLRVAGAGRRCVRLAWAPVAGATSYAVQRRTGVGWTAPVRTTLPRWRGTRLPLAPRWRFRVRAERHGAPGAPTAITVARARSAAPCR
ncbi:GDSL-type esterase/lipase family protein [Nocardioides sp. WV_118_6]|uniref:GDSL-type esterase/lipase family protein n=1 Tax=Nocardioides simplex TaxID=2045 RepID=UPI00214FC1E6|nr:GDSL-type esterase/lipase family protein [Pimelobacter simplex]UUW87701.1 GDSL-type esterase/lipase family protein [Pimelobacter simplex]UUW97207.1 GDSL-type esterase/lipase family protein [Pimelobacter simplex]